MELLLNKSFRYLLANSLLKLKSLESQPQAGVLSFLYVV